MKLAKMHIMLKYLQSFCGAVYIFKAALESLLEARHL